MTFLQQSGVQSSQERAEQGDFLEQADISELLEMLATIKDTRAKRARQHELPFILAVCIVAVLAGAKGYAEIARRTRGMSNPLLAKLGAGWDWFRCRRKFPSETTIRRVLSGTDAGKLDKITGKWLADHAGRGDDGELAIAVDGKVLRGAWTSGNDQVTLFSAMIQREGITIAQVRVPDGTNEITQAAALMDVMPIPEDRPALFTLDAAHTQRETASEITKRPGWDYLMEVKGNQPKLHRAVFDAVLPFLRGEPHHIMEDRSRGRLKKWSCWISGAAGIDFPGARQVAVILREVFDALGDRISKEIAIMLTSRDAGAMTAADLNRHKRNHWGIENRSHYPRDTVYHEDHGQTWSGEGPHVLASLRNLAIGLMRIKGHAKIKETTEWVSENRDRAAYFMAT